MNLMKVIELDSNNDMTIWINISIKQKKQK